MHSEKKMNILFEITVTLMPEFIIFPAIPLIFLSINR